MTSVDLLNARHTAWSTIQTENFICAVAEALARMSRNLPDPSTDFNEMVNALDNLALLLNNTDPNVTPEDYFDLENFGHFKECYSISPHFVLKFCAERNPTREERKLLQDAKENGMDHMFVPSEYIELPRHIESSNLEKDDDESEAYDEELHEWGPNPEWHDNTLFTHICIQAQVHPLGYDEDGFVPEVAVHHRWDETRESLSLPPEEKPIDWEGLSGCAIPWVKSVINTYGLDFTKQFAAFCAEYHVWDLHADNVGYTLPAAGGKSLPVILDWLSR